MKYIFETKSKCIISHVKHIVIIKTFNLKLNDFIILFKTFVSVKVFIELILFKIINTLATTLFIMGVGHFPDNDFPDNDFPNNDFPDNDFPDNDFPDNDFPDNDFPDNDFPDNSLSRQLTFPTTHFPDR